MLKLSYSKPFYNTLYYASTANIIEVMKFYNPGNKSFETDFSYIRMIQEVIPKSKPERDTHLSTFMARLAHLLSPVIIGLLMN